MAQKKTNTKKQNALRKILRTDFISFFILNDL